MPIKVLQHAGRAGQQDVPFQDRGHGTTTERRTMTFFCAPAKRDDLVAGFI